MSPILCLLLSRCFGATGGTVLQNFLWNHQNLEYLWIFWWSSWVWWQTHVCCDTWVLCSACPWWSQDVIVVSWDFRRMMMLQFGFRGLSVMGNSRPSLSYPLETCESSNVTQKDDVTVWNDDFWILWLKRAFLPERQESAWARWFFWNCALSFSCCTQRAAPSAPGNSELLCHLSQSSQACKDLWKHPCEILKKLKSWLYLSICNRKFL